MIARILLSWEWWFRKLRQAATLVVVLLILTIPALFWWWLYHDVTEARSVRGHHALSFGVFSAIAAICLSVLIAVFSRNALFALWSAPDWVYKKAELILNQRAKQLIWTLRATLCALALLTIFTFM